MRKNNKPDNTQAKKIETVLTWIVFGMSLLRPVTVESDSVFGRPTGTAVEQRFICAVSIQRLCTERVEHKEKLTQGHKKHAENTPQLEHRCFDLPGTPRG